jgi:cytochrome c-type biogenesis protein CcmH/NrfG
VDDPQNGVLVMMLSQALFATQQFNDAAGAVQAATQMLPPDKWDVVIKNFRDLYGKGEDYTTQLRALEKQAREKPDDASLRFLLGFHYGYLGYPTEAVKQLEKCVSLAPQDEVGRKLLKVFSDKLPKKPDAPAEPPAPGVDPVNLPSPSGDAAAPALNSEPSNPGSKKP